MRLKRLMQFCALVSVLGLLLSVAALAGTRGKISGKVLDGKTGEPLPGANVNINAVWLNDKPAEMATPMGAVTDGNGDFVILNMNPGFYNIQVRYIGYTSKIFEKVEVSINRTTAITARLEQTVITGQAVTVTAVRDVIQKDMTSSMRTISSDQMEKLNLESVGAVVALQPGVVEGHFRGGRAGEVAYLVEGIQSGLSLDADVVQEVEVISGTFNAEYGKVMSGIVNVAAKEGGTKYTGDVKLFTSNYYTNHPYIGLKKEDIFHATELRFNVGGLIPFSKGKMTFFLYGRNSASDGLYYGIRRYNMWDYTKVSTSTPREQWIDIHTGDMAEVPMSEGTSSDVTANIIWRAPMNIKVGLLYQYGQSQGQGYSHAYKYTPDRTNTNWSTQRSAILSLTHTLSKRAFHELKASYTDLWSQSSRFKDPYDPGYVHDKYSTSQGGFTTGGNDKGFSYNSNDRLEFKYDLTWQAATHHELKMGADLVRMTRHPYSFSLQNKYKNTPYEADLYEPTIWGQETTYTNEYIKHPQEFSAYVQDKSEFDELVINYGLRYDWFDPNTIYPTDIRNPANKIEGTRHTDYAEAKPQYQVSPRIGLSYSVASAAALHFSYGHFFQIPDYGRMYENPDYEVASLNYASTIGNPNIKAEKTVKYELGLQLQVMERMVLNTTIYYHDIYNLESKRPVETYDAIIFGYYINKDYASTKGVTVSMDYSTRNLVFNANYTLQYAEGNASDPSANFLKAAGSVDPIKKFVPLDWDQRHTVNLAAAYHGSNYGLSLQGRIGSGMRYTLDPYYTSRLAIINIPENGMTKPMTMYWDGRAFYKLKFLSFARVTPELGFYVYNLFDRRNELVVYGDSGRAGSTLSIEEGRDKYVSTFTTIEDRYYQPNFYSAPRSWKFELTFNF